MPGADDRPWIIEKRQPYCLHSKKLPFPIDKKVILLQLLCGVKYYHDNNKMHRDIKPLNVLLEIVTIDEDPATGLVKRRVVAKYTDHGEVVSTDRPVKGIVGTPFYFAPEVLDEQQYDEMADIFSLGVLFLRLFTGYDPSSDDSYGGKWPLSSSDVQVWMQKVDQILWDRCDVKFEPLIRGMLLRHPSKRWPVDKCLAYMQELDQSPTSDQTFSVGLQLPWGTRPLTAAQIRKGHKRNYEEFERDDVVKSDDGVLDDGESDDGRIVTLAASDPLPNGSGTKNDQSNHIFLKDDEPATPKLSCAAQLPVTPCLGDIEEDELPSAFCTPVVDDRVTGPANRRATSKPEVYRFDWDWDWDDSVKVDGSDNVMTSHQPQPRLQLGIFGSNWGYCPPTRRLATTKQAVPTQQLTKDMLNAMQRAEGGDDDEDSEAETVRDVGDKEPETPPDANDDSDPEAKTVRDVGDRESEAPSSGRRVAQRKAPIETYRRDEQPKASDGPKAFVFPQLSRNRQRKVLGTTQANNNRRRKTRYDPYKDLSFNIGGGRFEAVIR